MAIVVTIEDCDHEVTSLNIQKKYDKLVKMSHQLDTLYNTVSHELRTPLNGIQLTVKQLFKMDLDDEKHRSSPTVNHLIRLIYF